MPYLFLAARLLSGAVFAISLASKLRNRAAWRAFSRWLGGLPVPGRRAAPGTAIAIAVAEAAIACLIAVPVTSRAGLLLAVVTLGLFAAGTALAVHRGVRAPCRCFGASDVPLGRGHVIRNVLLAAAAAAGAAAGPGPLHPAGIVLSAAAAAVAVLLVLFSDDLVAIVTGPPAAQQPARAAR